MDNLELTALNGTDLDSLNAFINAVRAGTFVSFSEHFTKDLPAFFKKCFLKTEQGLKDLSIAYKTLPLAEVKKLWQEILQQRQQELSFLLEPTEVNYDNLNDLEKIKYHLLYMFGDKIGGYPAVASLNVEETLKLHSIFVDLKQKEQAALTQVAANNKENR